MEHTGIGIVNWIDLSNVAAGLSSRSEKIRTGSYRPGATSYADLLECCRNKLYYL